MRKFLIFAVALVGLATLLTPAHASPRVFVNRGNVVVHRQFVPFTVVTPFVSTVAVPVVVAAPVVQQVVATPVVQTVASPVVVQSAAFAAVAIDPFFAFNRVVAVRHFAQNRVFINHGVNRVVVPLRIRR